MSAVEHPYRTAELRLVRESITFRRDVLRAELALRSMAPRKRLLLQARVRDLNAELDALDATPEGRALADERSEISPEDRAALARLAKALVR